jgi:hypothetical protein
VLVEEDGCGLIIWFWLIDNRKLSRLFWSYDLFTSFDLSFLYRYD